MVRIRLQRMGRKKRPEYRVIVVDQRTRRDGRSIETLGLYFPQRRDEEQLRLDTDRAKHWLGVGAQPTDTVRGLFHRVGVLEGRAPSLGKPDQPSKASLAAQAQAEAEAEAAQAEAAAAATAAAEAAPAAAAAPAEAEAAAPAEAEAEATEAKAEAAEPEATDSAEAPEADAPKE